MSNTLPNFLMVGLKEKGKTYLKWPHDEASEPLGVGAVKVWYEKVPAKIDTLPIEGYCVVNACLDETGRFIPEALPLWPEMEGHEVCIAIFVDMYDRISIKAIGGFTTYNTRYPSQ